MSDMASQITSFSVVYSILCSDADQRKHQSSAPLAFVRGIHRWPVNSPHRGPVTRKMFPFDDVIMKYSSFRLSHKTQLWTFLFSKWVQVPLQSTAHHKIEIQQCEVHIFSCSIYQIKICLTEDKQLRRSIIKRNNLIEVCLWGTGTHCYNFNLTRSKSKGRSPPQNFNLTFSYLSKTHSSMTSQHRLSVVAWGCLGKNL